MALATPTRRLLGSNLVDLLVGPHGIDRYLELVRPEATIRDARARVTAVTRQTPRSVTLALAANSAWRGFTAGQFVRIGVEIDGVRRTRTYSPSCSQHAAGVLELTITAHPGGLVSNHLVRRARPGMLLHLGAAQGEFVLPHPRPERLTLISGGSGITPVLSMLRTLRDEGYNGELTFIHYARTREDWLYRSEVEAMSGVRSSFIATRQGGARLQEGTLAAERDALIAVCGPPRLIEAVRALRSDVLSETFTPPSLTTSGAAARGQLRFMNSQKSVAIGEGSLLEQAESAGLSPEYGCRMGICHTCTCRKAAGAVKNVLTGEVSEEEDEDIQLCISVPAGDVALQI